MRRMRCCESSGGMLADHPYSWIALDGMEAMKRTLTTLLLIGAAFVGHVYAQDDDAFGNRLFNPCEDVEGASMFKPLSEIRAVLQEDGDRLPPDCSSLYFTEKSAGDAPRFESDIAYHWMPTNFFHMPAYFDDVPLERYGQSCIPLLQPAITGAKFYLQVPAIPYKMGIDAPHSCVTTLGHRPPGNCVPCIRQTLPFQADAALIQGATAVGLAVLLP